MAIYIPRNTSSCSKSVGFTLSKGVGVHLSIKLWWIDINIYKKRSLANNTKEV